MKEGPMTIGNVYALELKNEATATRKIIERLPEDKFQWQPHEKSMKLSRLAGHVVEMIGWTIPTIKQDELDFSTMNYTPTEYTKTSELLDTFDKNIAESTELLSNVSDADMMKNWTLRNGETIYFTMPKVAVMRSMVMNHIIHHRGQLSVYIRLLNVPVPEIYGPSADEGSM
jgi:uncharacterized damage-inducible protein DinB